MKKAVLFFLLVLFPFSANAVSTQAEQESLANHNRLVQRRIQRDKSQKQNRVLDKIKKDNDESEGVEEKFKKKFSDLEKNVQFNLSYDNSGNKAVGEKIETLGLIQKNLFGDGDSLTINRSGNDIADKTRNKVGGNNTFLSIYSIPVGEYDLSFVYARATYFTMSSDPVDSAKYEISGDAIVKTLNVNKNFIKNKKYQFGGNISIAHDDSDFFINHVKSLAGSRRITNGTIGFTGAFFFDDQSSLFLNPSYNRSLNLFSAQKDQNNLSSTDPHFEFHSWSLNGNYSKKFKVAKMASTYNLSFSGQGSDKALYANDQFSIGGLYTVRGFKEGSISGDSGYNVRNEVTLEVGKNIFSALNAGQGLTILSQINNFSVTPFYDYGYVRSKGGQSSGRLSGTGARFDFIGKNITASLTTSWAVTKSQHLGIENHKNAAIFFNISSRFGI